MPTIFTWTGDEFIENDDSFPQFYKQLADENRHVLTEKDSGVYELYGEAVFLYRAGHRKEALATLKRIRTTVANFDDLELIHSCAELLDKVGAKNEALALALELRKTIYRYKDAAHPYNPKENYFLNYVDPQVAYDCAVLLAKAGRKKEALALLRRVWTDVANSDDPELVTSYNRLLCRIKKVV